MPFEEGSVNLLSLLVILTSVFAYMLIIFLLFVKSEGRIGKWLISLVILQYSLWVFPDFLHILGLLDNFPHAVRIYVVGSFLLGPLTYFYVKFCIEKDFRVTPIMYWHFLPAVIDLFFQIQFYTLSGDDKLSYFYNFFLQNSFQQPLWLTLIKIIQMIAYMLACLYLIQAYKVHLKDNASSIDQALHRLLTKKI